MKVLPKNNFWVLLTEKETKDFILGEISTNYRTTEKSYIEIHNEIEQKLNAYYPFDKPIDLLKKDILKIKLSTDEVPKGEYFCYQYSGNKWKAFISDPFTESEYEKKVQGSIEMEEGE